jgi:hypothetical protein
LNEDNYNLFDFKTEDFKNFTQEADRDGIKFKVLEIGEGVLVE